MRIKLFIGITLFTIIVGITSFGQVYAEYNGHGRDKQLLDVPIIKQYPELKYGCEVTSLAMVLQYVGFEIDKVELAQMIAKDDDELIQTRNGDIQHWGNPDDGFVGDMTGKQQRGYAVFDKPLEHLMQRFLSYRVVNLTNKPFDRLLKQIEKNRPVIVWTTGDYKLPDRWEEWKHGQELIKTPLDLHVVVLVGYDDRYVYVNDPRFGLKAAKVDKETFIDSWEALKKRAISYD